MLRSEIGSGFGEPAAQTDMFLFGVLHNKYYINYDFQITKNYRQQKIYMANKLLID